MKKISLILILFFLLTAAPAQAKISGQTDDATVIGGGARPLGMGRAFTAIADDVDAPFINPAGMANLRGPSIMTMFTNILQDVYYYEYSGGVPTPYGTMGLGFITTGVNRIPVTDASGTVYTDYNDSLLVLSYSTSLARYFRYCNNISAGFNFKMYNRGFTGGVNSIATGISADFGLKFIATPYLSFGICRQNILPLSLGGVLHYNTGVEETLSGVTKIGVAIKPMPLKGNLLLAFDADLPAVSTRPLLLHAGGEYKLFPYLVVRAGLDQSIDASTGQKTRWDPTYGVSLDMYGFRVDYAYHQYYNQPELATSYISLSYTAKPWLEIKGGPSEAPSKSRRNTFQ